ncbi:hypothetical protein MHU86_2306 [Fragilaria crotonensis]|nr:hypothetical protein MHU86_2306 [Fragilaria crotonensis]
MTTGELIYALIVARIEIFFAIVKLSQFNANPALIHYKTIRRIFAYLNNTREDGLIYWRPQPRVDLPAVAAPVPRSHLHNRLPVHPQSPILLLAYSNSDWGSDTSHRRSVSGTIILLSGPTVLFSTKYQKAIALSSTEAEFVSVSDAGKSALYLRALLNDLGFDQSDPTTLLIDNTGAVFMVDAQAPTQKEFVIYQSNEDAQLQQAIGKNNFAFSSSDMDEDVSVAIGGINTKWTWSSGAPRLRWFPKVVRGALEDDYYAVDDDVVWVPYHVI